MVLCYDSPGKTHVPSVALSTPLRAWPKHPSRQQPQSGVLEVSGSPQLGVLFCPLRLPRLGLRKRRGAPGPSATSLPHPSSQLSCGSPEKRSTVASSQAQQASPSRHTLNSSCPCLSVKLHLQASEGCSWCLQESPENREVDFALMVNGFDVLPIF